MSRALSEAERLFTLDLTVDFLLFGNSVRIHDRQLSADLAPVLDRHRPFLRRFKCCQIQGFQERLRAREDTSLTIQLPQRRIQGFDRVCGIEGCPGLFRELKNRGDRIPIIVSPLHRIWVLPFPFLRYTVHLLQRCLFVRSRINRL